MTGSLWPWLLGVAVLSFWALGAHNRVVALRGAVLAAWVPLDAVLQARGAAVGTLLAAIEQPLKGEHQALEAARHAQAHVEQAAATLRRKPAAADAVGALAASEAVWSGVMARLVALVEQQADLRADAAVAPPLQLLQAQAPQWQFARQAFNEAGAAYNAAIAQFPTRLLCSLFSFEPAGRL